MSDSKRYTAPLILKMCGKYYRKIIHGRALHQKCSATVAPIYILALLIFPKSANNALTQNPFLCIFASIPLALETFGSIFIKKLKISKALTLYWRHRRGTF
jgi:hypothetical protein